jgi:hypothetical protein
LNEIAIESQLQLMERKQMEAVSIIPLQKITDGAGVRYIKISVKNRHFSTS